MKKTLSITLAALSLAGTPAFAAGRIHFGLSIGVPLWGAPYYYPPYYAPYYYPPYYYPPYYAPPAYLPPVVAPPSAPAFIEQPRGQEAPMWYYCADTKTYYPYVKQCASEWQRVPATPPPG